MRALTAAVFARLRARIAEVAAGTAAAHGCAAEVTWSDVPYPPTVNHPSAAALLRATAAAFGLALARNASAAPGVPVAPYVELEEPSMAAEDFSFYTSETPSAFGFLGIGDEALGTTASLHNPAFRVDERVLPLGAAVHAGMAIGMLRAHVAHAAAAGLGSEDRSEL